MQIQILIPQYVYELPLLCFTYFEYFGKHVSIYQTAFLKINNFTKIVAIILYIYYVILLKTNVIFQIYGKAKIWFCLDTSF